MGQANFRYADVYLHKILTVTGATTLSSTLAVTGATTMTGALAVDDTTDATSSAGSIQTDGGISMAKKLYVGTSSTFKGVIASDDTTEATSTVGAIQSDGGISAAKKVAVGTDLLMVGGDIDMSTASTTTYDLILKDSQADALSIRRSTTDMMVFDSSTPKITITPAVAITGAVTGGSFVVSSQTAQAYKAEYNITASQGAWVHGVKVELTRTANIQPATGGWFGGQFVLNAGSEGGYAILDKKACALAVIFKGSRTLAATAECNVTRFETQSSGKVDDICYILANTGTAVEGSLLYCATHIAPGDSIVCLNVQSSQTVTKAIRFTAGSGSTMTSLLYCDGDGTFTNFFEVAATGDGGLTVGTTDIASDLTADAYLRIKVGSNHYKALLWAYSP